MQVGVRVAGEPGPLGDVLVRAAAEDRVVDQRLAVPSGDALTDPDLKAAKAATGELKAVSDRYYELAQAANCSPCVPALMKNVTCLSLVRPGVRPALTSIKYLK